MTLERDRYLDDGELRGLLRAARERDHPNARRDHVLLALLGNTGLRPSEALALKGEDLHLTDHHAWIRVRRLKRRREGGVISDLEISRGLARALRVYVERAKIPSPAPLFPITLRRLEKMFRLYARRASLNPVYHLYALRHTAITRIIAATGDLRLAQELAGHASPTTTAIYAHIAPERRRQVVESVASVL